MFLEAIKSGLSNYVNFSGRAARWQFWYWVLFVFIITIVANLIDAMMFSSFSENGIGLIGGLVSLALFIPGISVSVRRLHDLDRTGWWVLLSFTVIGIILLIVWDCMKGTDGPNRFGPDPLG